MDRAELIEAMARAMAPSAYEPDAEKKIPPVPLAQSRRMHLKWAKAALRAIEEAGYILVRKDAITLSPPSPLSPSGNGDKAR